MNAHAQRFRAKANGPWSTRQVVATLHNPVYVGRFKDGKSVRPERLEPIISMDLFEAVVRALDSRRTGGPKRPSGERPRRRVDAQRVAEVPTRTTCPGSMLCKAERQSGMAGSRS